jgi:uncharacterized protein YkwD
MAMVTRVGTWVAVAVFGIAQAASAACPLPGNAGDLTAGVAQGVNAQRQARGLPPLVVSQRLAQAAQAHACDMAENGIRSHTGSGGRTFARRYRGSGGCGSGGENIAWGMRSPGSAIEWWMNSPPHRANILHRQAAEYGIGVAVGSDGPSWVLIVGRTC